ncbi:YkvI family membrane protein [Bacilliculturomica massiliensis]|uniref:YkvI family membrane protein n=1 Tax=Bacilliculturomica massiliensis TaxID=1917867 RepID=UPI00103022DD|nr:hypothetical protein [Bacilliculturomica massiliensis]
MKENSNFSWKTVIMLGGAYASYNIGSGFASGQEVLQFFGSWGGMWPFITPLIPLLIITIYGASGYSLALHQNFENPSDAYEYYCGKYIAKFMDIFSMIMIAGIGLVMFAGCGATIHQYLGLPVYVGAVGLGLISVLVVWLGLEKVTQVLGVTGILIIAFILVVSIYTLATADVGLMEAQQNIPQYVSDGRILQAGLFGVNHPIIAALFYAGMTLLTSFPFMVALGKSIKNRKEAVASGLASGILFTLGVYLVVFSVLQNIDYIVETGAQVPMLAVIAKNLPFLSVIFTLVIVCGIFTTITGYLWLVGRRFAQDGTMKQKIIVAATAIIGIFAGSVVPFGTLINILYPFAGCVGVLLFIIIIFNEVRRRMNPTEKTDA